MKRKLQHFSDLKCGRHTSDYLQKSYNKYGHSSFNFEILEEADDLSEAELNDREVFWIDFDNSYYEGYNLTIGGDGTKGRAFSEEERKIRALKMTGSGNHFFGRKHSIETRLKISGKAFLRTRSKNSFYGKTNSKGWRQKRQLLYKKKEAEGWIAPNKGVAIPIEVVKCMKKNMPHNNEIIVNGIEHAIISEWSRQLGMHRATIRLRLGREDFPNYKYKH